jgi:hypothetical protein
MSRFVANLCGNLTALSILLGFARWLCRMFRLFCLGFRSLWLCFWRSMIGCLLFDSLMLIHRLNFEIWSGLAFFWSCGIGLMIFRIHGELVAFYKMVMNCRNFLDEFWPKVLRILCLKKLLFELHLRKAIYEKNCMF